MLRVSKRMLYVMGESMSYNADEGWIKRLNASLIVLGGIKGMDFGVKQDRTAHV